MHDAALCAKQYLEDLLSFFGLKVDVSYVLEDDCIQLDIPSTYLNGFLIGRFSETLKAIHTLTSASVQQQTKQFYRLDIDVAGYKKQKVRRLYRQVEFWVKEIKDSGQPKKLRPMPAPDRRIVHQAASDQGIKSESKGEGKDRYIVLKLK